MTTATAGARPPLDLGRRAVRGEHQRRAGRNVADVVDEDDALVDVNSLDDQAVVDDLVVAVDGRLEDPHHPGEGLDRHLDTGAEAPRLGEQDFLHRHAA